MYVSTISSVYLWARFLHSKFGVDVCMSLYIASAHQWKSLVTYGRYALYDEPRSCPHRPCARAGIVCRQTKACTPGLVHNEAEPFTLHIIYNQ